MDDSESREQLCDIETALSRVSNVAPFTRTGRFQSPQDREGTFLEPLRERCRQSLLGGDVTVADEDLAHFAIVLHTPEEG